MGQSTHANEWQARPYVDDGLEVVRYSPREREIPNYAGESTMIRFYKDPDEYTGWHGSDPRVLIITQNPVERQAWVGHGLDAGGPEGPAAPHRSGRRPRSSVARARCRRTRSWRPCAPLGSMLYTGTIPASYTLGLIEAMMTGMPVVAIGPQAWSWPAKQTMPYAPRLYEGHAIAPLFADDPREARTMLQELLNDADYAAHVGAIGRERAITLFGKDRVYAAWRGWLDGKVQPEPGTG